MTYNAFLFPEAILDTPRLFTAIAEWLAIFVYFTTKTNQWVREGGLFVIVFNLITVLKYFLLQFLPYVFVGMGDQSFGWPGISVTLFGETFQWNILGYDQAHGGLAYFMAYMTAMIIGECINFPIQKHFVFRSKGNTGKQIAWYAAAFCIITCIVNYFSL